MDPSCAIFATATCLTLSLAWYRRKDSSELDISNNPRALREISKKQALRAKQQDVNDSKASKREPGHIPPGNFKTSRFLVTDLGAPIVNPCYSLEPHKYRLKFFMCDTLITELSLHDIEGLGMEQFNVDWHCVTGWSCLGLSFKGVPVTKLIDYVLQGKNADDWKYMFQVSGDGYTTVVRREDIRGFFATRTPQGELISSQHGGPRFVFPHLWGWKSGKYLVQVHFLTEYRAGFYEKLMCNERGRVYDADTNEFVSERWQRNKGSEGFWNFATTAVNLVHRFIGVEAYANAMTYSARVFGIIVRPLLWVKQAS